MPIATDETLRYGGSPIERRRSSYFTDRPQQEREDIAERRARGLGWFSIGLGLAQIGAPRTMARLVGVSDDDETRNTMFAIGLREITSGIGILSRPRRAGWVWSRVGGDLMDLALLGKALNSDENDKGRVAATTAAVLGVAVVDFLTGQQLSRESNGSGENGERAPGERVSGGR